MKIGEDVEMDTLLAAKILVSAALVTNQAGKIEMEVEDAAVADGKTVKARITVEVIDE